MSPAMAYDTSYGYTRALPATSLPTAVERITAALKDQGFGVLTTIDVKDTLKKKLDQDFRPYVILGACNPKLAYRALQAELAVGLLLPCNVTVFEDGADSVIQVVKPAAMLSVVERPEMAPIAAEADQGLRRALERA